VFAAPLAILLYLAGMRYWQAPGLWGAVQVGFWSVLCALAKPNYLLAFFPIFGPALLVLAAREAYRGRLTAAGALGHAAAAFVPPLATLSLQYVYAFEGEAKAVFLPLTVWRALSPNIPASVFLGVAYPCAVAACYPREVLGDRRTLVSWCVLAVAVAQFLLLAEVPEGRLYCANFGWAMLPASYILFMESCRLAGGRPAGARAAACAAALALHAATGTFYLLRSVRFPLDCQAF
jgi:hypothetical protein